MNLHVVSFDIPFPADYGGVIDVYAKLMSLHQNGINIHLHCFKYGRQPSEALENICQSVHYYERKHGLLSQLDTLPYIIRSRSSIELLQNLTEDEFPILFEGIHSTYFLNHPKLAARNRWVRLHNIEHLYYRELAYVEKNLLNKVYYQIESKRLRAYQKKLSYATGLAAISLTETQTFSLIHSNTHWVPAFHLGARKQTQQARDYYLFSGDFTIGTNKKAAIELAKELDNHVPFCLAGKMSSEFVSFLKSKFTSLISHPNPSEDEMTKLLSQAKGHILYAHHSSGVKLKLLHAIATGAPVLANKAILRGSKLGDEVTSFENPSEIPKLLRLIENQDHTSYPSFEEYYDNDRNAKKLIQLIF